jgi:hypothetical protein
VACRSESLVRNFAEPDSCRPPAGNPATVPPIGLAPNWRRAPCQQRRRALVLERRRSQTPPRGALLGQHVEPEFEEALLPADDRGGAGSAACA